MQLERNAALALVDAGYMPLSEYIGMFANDVAPGVLPTEALEAGHHRAPSWSIAAQPVRPAA